MFFGLSQSLLDTIKGTIIFVTGIAILLVMLGIEPRMIAKGLLTASALGMVAYGFYVGGFYSMFKRFMNQIAEKKAASHHEEEHH